MKKASFVSFVLVGAMAIAIIYLAIALISARTELRAVKAQLVQTSAEAEIWQTAFRDFYSGVSARLSFAGAYSRVIARQLGLEDQRDRLFLFQTGLKAFDHELGLVGK